MWIAAQTPKDDLKETFVDFFSLWFCEYQLFLDQEPKFYPLKERQGLSCLCPATSCSIITTLRVPWGSFQTVQGIALPKEVGNKDEKRRAKLAAL